LNILVLGGYGNFGARICKALANTPGIALIVAGRDRRKALALADSLHAQSAVVDIDDPALAATLQALGAGLVIHTAGPFQQQGYKVAQAAAEAGAHYIDLADGRRFVCDFPAQLDAAFRARGRIGISGASSVPSLSSAVVDHLCAGWRSIDTIDTCIAPAQTAPRGVATMAAVLGYCGAPIEVWQDGRWTSRYGWAAPTRVAYARLRPRLAALCDIPDLELFPAHYKGVRSVMFRAALEIGISQRGLAAMGALRRIGLVRRPERYAAFLNRAAGLLDPFGSALGGMVVRVTGSGADGAQVARAWHLAADHDHGPEIPCMAAIILARRLAAGGIAQVGACTATGMLALAEFAPQFAQWGIVTDIVDEQVKQHPDEHRQR